MMKKQRMRKLCQPKPKKNLNVVLNNLVGGYRKDRVKHFSEVQNDKDEEQQAPTASGKVMTLYQEPKFHENCHVVE